MLHTPVTIIALVGCRSLCCSICGLITRDANVAWEPPIFNINPMAVESIFCDEGAPSQDLARTFIVVSQSSQSGLSIGKDGYLGNDLASIV
jgi:hypothetical protein